MSNFFLPWCYKDPLKREKTTHEVIEELCEIITAVQMKMAKNKYVQEEHLRRAQLLYKKGEKEEMMSEMRKKYNKNQQYIKWMYILEQLQKIHGDIDSSMGLEDVYNSFRTADNILHLALKKINPDDVHDLMDNIEHNMMEIKEINNALSDTSRFYIEEYTEESVINEIEKQNKIDESIQFIEIPSRPIKKIAVIN